MRRRLLCLFAGVAVLILAIFTGVTNHSLGQSGNGFRISPVRVEKTIEKGQSSTAKIMIENPTPQDINARVAIHDFEPAADETGQPRIIFDENKSASGNSFKTLVAPIQDIFIPSKGKKEITVYLSVPNNASSGGYYGAIRVLPNGSSNDQSNVSLSASVGTLFLITVPGGLTEQLQLVDFSAARDSSTGRLFINSGKIQIITRLKNTGNVHVKPFGKVQVSDRSGKVVQEYEFNNTEPQSNVLPNSTRKFEDNLKDQKWFGKYTITANLGYGSTGSLITAKNTFWVIPMWLVIIAGLLVIALVVAGFFIYKKFANNKKHKASLRR